MKKLVKTYFILEEEDKKYIMEQLWERGLNLSKFAEQIGLSLVYISNILNGRKNITARIVSQFEKQGVKLFKNENQ